eukprot:gb/GECG01007123.1/.p1 GENE.gb/GECG01007123.1/~~gb/GECG01007123.1/.p1  ORF type:complete len:120 (+),score=7.62 gb/GECG01007123.1/:1-360(+)
MCLSSLTVLQMFKRTAFEFLTLLSSLRTLRCSSWKEVELTGCRWNINELYVCELILTRNYTLLLYQLLVSRHTVPPTIPRKWKDKFLGGDSASNRATTNVGDSTAKDTSVLSGVSLDSA